MKRPLLRLQAAGLTSSLDRFAIGPLLLTIAADLEAGLDQVAMAATLYYLLYGTLQPVWGVCSDRLGRVRTIRLTLAGAAIAGGLSALAPSLGPLLVLRALTGAFYAAVFPTAMVYIGDTVDIGRRQRALADLLAASSLGTLLANVGAGFAAAMGAWRVAFAIPAVMAAVIAIGLARVPEPVRCHPRGMLAGLGQVLRRPWAVLVVVIAFFEGAIVHGLLTYFAASLESAGVLASVAGLAASVFGVGVLSGTRVVKRLATRLAPAALIAMGGTVLASGLALAGTAAGAAHGGGDGQVALTALGALLLGWGFAWMHSTIQTWATMVAPAVRAPTIALFAAAVFAGGSVAAGVGAPLAEAGRFSSLFAAGALIAVPLTWAASWSRRRFDERPEPGAGPAGEGAGPR